MAHSTRPLAVTTLLLVAATAPLPAQGWRLDPAPALRIGRAESEESGMLTTVVGATRRADGHILVGDRGDWNLLLFDAKGQLVKRLARKGKGPGEIEFHAFMWRCGDTVYTYDIDGYRISVFSLDGTVQRTFRFGSPTAGEPPYRSACNADARFVHNGWGKEDRTRGLDRAQRTSAPYWLSRADSAVGPTLGTHPSSERYVFSNGSRPLPLGRDARLAIGPDRVYLGTAESYEILVFTLDGKPLPPIRKAAPARPVTRADIDAELEREIATSGERARKSLTAEWGRLPFPKTLPPYLALVVDADGWLWVQDYPRASDRTVTWTVFDRTGTQRATVAMPRDLEPYEIGRDHVLGRFVDYDEGVPEVRMYRLQRGR